MASKSALEIATTLPSWLRSWAVGAFSHTSAADAWGIRIREFEHEVRTMLSNRAVGKPFETEYRRLCRKMSPAAAQELLKAFIWYSAYSHNIAHSRNFRSASALRRDVEPVINQSRKLANMINNIRPFFAATDVIKYLAARKLGLTGLMSPLRDLLYPSSATTLSEILKVFADDIETQLNHKTKRRSKVAGNDEIRNFVIDACNRHARRLFGHVPYTLIAKMTGPRVQESTVRTRANRRGI